ncbi:MAG: 4'-phosphopantetheinyl transferase superfamily protein [Bacteriovorax sp.]|nr:4'-phosphopantetheinyl transferase superfamily protein [Bacteriovorax sp.]
MDKIALLKHSSFFLIQKENFDNDDVQVVLSKLCIVDDISRFHPERRKEFLLGRYCAYKAYEKLLGQELISLISQSDRSPKWPYGVVGSISHNHNLVCCGISTSEKLIGLGVDIEQLGRTKPEMGRYIRTKEDLDEHEYFDEISLLTFIFSAKESLYKALYPEVKKFFGFEYASVTEINFANKTFKIQLLKDLNSQFNLEGRHHFEGRFALMGDNLLTAIEIAP